MAEKGEGRQCLFAQGLKDDGLAPTALDSSSRIYLSSVPGADAVSARAPPELVRATLPLRSPFWSPPHAPV